MQIFTEELLSQLATQVFDTTATLLITFSAVLWQNLSSLAPNFFGAITSGSWEGVLLYGAVIVGLLFLACRLAWALLCRIIK